MHLGTGQFIEQQQGSLQRGGLHRVPRVQVVELSLRGGVAEEGAVVHIDLAEAAFENGDGQQPVLDVLGGQVRPGQQIAVVTEMAGDAVGQGVQFGQAQFAVGAVDEQLEQLRLAEFAGSGDPERPDVDPGVAGQRQGRAGRCRLGQDAVGGRRQAEGGLDVFQDLPGIGGLGGQGRLCEKQGECDCSAASLGVHESSASPMASLDREA